ncbi:uncharacterized protein LOC8032550 [Ixodes scapularis]|uniref:uncharacterized protein LOC8032550 n=1 Tax=Ixodes scapularis TaxID=6945 RepID=UPI001C38935D|nr:uncharacterized protein LOC8032550 [Ixodes scapularis]
MESTTIRIALAVFFAAVILVFVEGDVGFGYRRRDRASVSRCPNPRLYFRNGVAKLRFRGRVAKYICLPGFTLFGESVATCYAGRWDRPVPICAAPGCRIPSRDLLSRGTVENYRNRGVMLLFRCRAGYALNGSSKAFCDGRSWNTSLPRCVPLVANPELSCDFEDPELCGWTADLSGSNQFTRRHLAAEEGDVSSHGHFMTVQYIGHPGLVEHAFPVARLTSPVFRPLTFKACFRFWYKLPCSLCSLRLLVWTSDTLTPVWSTYGPRESAEVNVSISAISEDFQLVFEARPSRKEITGLVIDDVRLELSECYVAMATEDVPTTIVADFGQNETSTNKEELGEKVGVNPSINPSALESERRF